MSRKSEIELNPAKIDNLITAVSLGMSVKRACDYAGIEQNTVYSYIHRAEEDERDGKADSVYIGFSKRLKEAKAKCQAVNLARIAEASKNGAWQASAWVLERCFPDEFGQKVQNSVDMQPVQIINDVPKRGSGE